MQAKTDMTEQRTKNKAASTETQNNQNFYDNHGSMAYNQVTSSDELSFDPSMDPTTDSIDMTGEGGIRGPPQACLYISGVAPETTESTLRNFFGCFGELVRVRVINTQSRPYAFVQFKTVESADSALNSSVNQSVDGRKLRIERARVNRTLFVAKIDRNLSPAQIRQIMEEFGEVETVTLIKNHTTQKSKGCGFVKYLYREDANKAVNGLKNTQKKWVVEWAQSNNDPETLGVDRCNLFVGGLNPAAVTKELLQQRFSQYGTVENITIINKDPDIHEAQDANFPRSAFAFVRFSDASSSATAIEHENGAEWLDRKIRVQYCESQEMKNKRKANKHYNYLQSYAQQFFSPVSAPFIYPYPVYNVPSNIPLPKGQEGEFPAAPYVPYPYMVYNQPFMYGHMPQQYIPPNPMENGYTEDEAHQADEQEGYYDDSKRGLELLHAMSNSKLDHVDPAAKHSSE